VLVYFFSRLLSGTNNRKIRKINTIE